VSARDGPASRGRRPRRLGARAAWPALAIVVAALVAAALVTHLAKPSRRTLVVASVPYWSIQHDAAVVLANRGAVNEVSPWIYGLSASGVIVPQYPSSEARTIATDVARFRSAQMAIVPSIANVTGGNWDYQAIARILHSPAMMRQHVGAITALVQREHYAGVDIDYEELHPGDRQAFTQFIQELAAALHADSKILSVAVFPRMAQLPGGDPSAFQDYAALGQAADQIRIMGYNEHWANSAPGATAPINWLRSVVQYATTQMPASKIVLGIPLFGNDWPPGGASATTVTWLQAMHLARDYDVTPGYSAANQSPYFAYTTGGHRHVVWFENAQSSRAKFEVVKSDMLAGVYLWMYGPEDPATWSALRTVLPTTGPNASSTSSVVP
jgi:spore germination protein